MRPGRPAAADGSYERPAGAAVGRGAALLGVGLVIGIVLLNRFDDVPNQRVGADDVPVLVTTTVPTSTLPSTTTIRSPKNPKDVKVLVANASGVNKMATRVRDELVKGLGYNVALSPATAAANAPTSTVYFIAGYEADATKLATGLMPTKVDVKALPPAPSPGPVANSQGAHLVLVVGKDLSDRLTAATATTVRGATTTTRPGGTTTTRPGGTTTTRPN